MLRIITGLLILIACSVPAFAQAAKGVDKSNERVRDTGSERTPANNGNKTDVGSGRGIDFGKGRTPETPPLPNPYRLSGRRDVIINAVQQLMQDRKLVVDDSASRLADGIIVSQPYTFTKAGVAGEADLSRYEGRTDGATGAEWTTLRSSGLAEDQFLEGLIINVTGAAPPGRNLPPEKP